jgi:hypothetical protein
VSLVLQGKGESQANCRDDGRRKGLTTGARCGAGEREGGGKVRGVRWNNKLRSRAKCGKRNWMKKNIAVCRLSDKGRRVGGRGGRKDACTRKFRKWK